MFAVFDGGMGSGRLGHVIKTHCKLTEVESVHGEHV